MQKLLNQIKAEPLARVYVVHGPEVVLHDAIYDALQERVDASGFGEWNWSVYDGHKDFSVDELITDLSTEPWGEGDRVVVLKDAHLVPSEELQRLAHWLQEHEPAGHLALFFRRLDTSLRYAKAFLSLGIEVQCNQLEGEELVKHVTQYCTARGKSIAKNACQLLLERTGADLQFVQSELDKLINYVGEAREITVEAVGEITSLAPGEAEDNAVFTMVDRITAGDQKGALEVLERLLDAGENPFRILPLIERQLRLLLAAKTRTTSFENTAQMMGERSHGPLRRVSRYAERFSIDELYEGFGAVVAADREMKLGSAGEAVLRDLTIRLTLLQKSK
ncbi:MAG: DNA polymerase III subunit delta [Firmicutes bacterium]|nr:DNA polymerase III subunit delta [Bacillota bacterium]